MGATEIYGWDSDNNKWVKAKVDDEGRLNILALIDKLNDIGDVNVPTPTDAYVIYYNDATSQWLCKNIDPVAVAAVEAAGLVLAAGKKIVFANDGKAQLGTLDGSPTLFGGRETQPHQLMIQAKDGNHLGEAVILPSGTQDKAELLLRNASDVENSGYLALGVDGLQAFLWAGAAGTGTAPNILRISFSPQPFTNEAYDLGEATYRWLESWIMHRQLAHPLPVNQTWAGLVAEMTAGVALSIRFICRVGADGKMEMAKANSAATMPAMAIATATIAEDAIGQFLLQGFFRDDTWDWTPGGLLYVDPDNFALLTQTLPAASGDQVQVVGVAITAGIIYFNPSYELVEIS